MSEIKQKIEELAALLACTQRDYHFWIKASSAPGICDFKIANGKMRVNEAMRETGLWYRLPPVRKVDEGKLGKQDDYYPGSQGPYMTERQIQWLHGAIEVLRAAMELTDTTGKIVVICRLGALTYEAWTEYDDAEYWAAEPVI